MKLPIVFLAFLGLVCGKTLPIGSLKDDLKEFLALVPTEKVLEITLDYLAYDPEVKEFVVYIQSEEFPKIHTIVERLREYQDCLKFFNDEGVDVYAVISEIHDFLGYPPFEPTNTTRMGVGFYGLIRDVFEVLPLEDWAALLDKKMETKELFKTLVTAIHSPLLMDMVKAVRAWPEYHELHKILQEKYVDVRHIYEVLKELYLRETRSIREDLHDYMEHFPTNKIFDIVLNYVAYDPEVKEFLVYIQSEKFPMIYKIVEYLKTYKDCLKFISDEGFDVYAYILEIHDFLGLPPLEPTNTTPMGVGIFGLIRDVVAVLPLDDLKAVFDKTEIRKYFKTLVTAIHSLLVKVVDTVRTWPEYKELLEIVRQIVREKVVDVDRIIELVRELYWRGTHTLKDDLKEFMALVPSNKVFEIVLDYLSNDEKLREFLVYIQSEEFPKIHKIVENLKEYKYCLKFINDEGVDVYEIILEIHDILHLPPLEPTNTTRMGVGIYGLIRDVVAVLPLEDLTTYLDKKLETKEFFKTLLTAVKSPVLMDMVYTVRAWPEYHELIKIVREMVVDLKPTIKLLKELTLRETQSLRDDVKEFMAVFPTHEVIQITLDYLADDPELHKIFAYIQSEEFPIIHKIVEYLKKYKYCPKFITDEGIDVYTFVLEIHDILDLPPFEPRNVTHMGVGIYGLIDDVFAVLPITELKALYDMKVKTRQYVKIIDISYHRIFVPAIQSPVFLNMVDFVRALPEYKKLLEIILKTGVDVEGIIKYLIVLLELPLL